MHLSPSGDTSKAVKVLLDKAVTYQSHIVHSRLPSEAALLSYNMYLSPQLGDPLPTMSLSEAECHKILSPTLSALLPKLHLNHNMAWSIIFGDPKYGGLGIKSLYSIQSLGQLTLFVGHLNA